MVGVGQNFLAAAKNDSSDLAESISTKLNINSDPALSLFSEKRRLIAEHLLVLDSHNLWFLPFQKKLASSSPLVEKVQIAGCVQGSAIFFEPVQGALFASPLLPLTVDLEINGMETHEISQFPTFGKFSKVKTSGENQIFATTSDGLVYCVKSPKHMCLKEKIWKADDSHFSLCAALKTVDENMLLPVTDEESGAIMVFMDTEREIYVQPIHIKHVSSEVIQLRRSNAEDGSYAIFSQKLKQVCIYYIVSLL